MSLSQVYTKKKFDSSSYDGGVVGQKGIQVTLHHVKTLIRGSDEKAGGGGWGGDHQGNPGGGLVIREGGRDGGNNTRNPEACHKKLRLSLLDPDGLEVFLCMMILHSLLHNFSQHG